MLGVEVAISEVGRQLTLAEVLDGDLFRLLALLVDLLDLAGLSLLKQLVDGAPVDDLASAAEVHGDVAVLELRIELLHLTRILWQVPPGAEAEIVLDLAGSADAVCFRSELLEERRSSLRWLRGTSPGDIELEDGLRVLHEWLTD